MKVGYFAYGANIDVPAMRRRCPSAVCEGTALLHDHRPTAMREGWLTVSHAPGDVTPGLLWSLEPSDILALDVYEDFEQGLYVKARRSVVRSSDDRTLDVMVYLGSNAGPGVLHREYASRVATAIRRELPSMGTVAEETADLIERLSRSEEKA